MTDDNCIPYGSDVSSGTFRCVDCGYTIDLGSSDSLPPCPRFDDDHMRKCWSALTGHGDAVDDPQN